MATAKPKRLYQPRRSLTRRLAPWVALLAAAVIAWFWRPIHDRAQASAAYAARTACSCHYVAGRPLSDCRDDLPSGTGFVSLAEDAEGKSVTARVPLLSRQTATFLEGQGCVLERWAD